MRKFVRWALLNAAVLSFGGLAHAADDFTVISLPGDIGVEESKPYEICQDDSIYQPVCDQCDPCLGNWHDNTLIYGGFDIVKSLGDRITNINGGTGALAGSVGALAGFNTGVALGDSGLRGQIGGSFGAYDPKGRLRIVPQATDTEDQQYVTAGVYKRGDMLHDCDPLSYGMVVDAFFAQNWGVNANAISLGQVRGIVGYALTNRSEVGSFATVNAWDDSAAVTIAGAPGVQRTIRSANQVNAYYRYNTDFGGSLMAYVGGFDNRDIQSWQFGLNGEAPLSHYCSLFGNFNYAAPHEPRGSAGSGEEQYSIQFGLCYYFGGKAVSKSVTGQRGLPLLDVGNNGSFLVTD